MAATLTLVQLNIEGSKHLNLVLPFLREQAADVVCLQELWERDVPAFEKELGGKMFFTPRGRDEGAVHGMGMLSALPVGGSREYWYGGSTEALPNFDRASLEAVHDSQCFLLAVCDVEKEGEMFRIGTTHFPVTKNGEATDFQRRDMQKLLSILAAQGELVFAGDFNAPRGGEIFGLLAERYKDNVPAHYTSSLDGNLHRAGPLPYMVDGIFSTPGYAVSDVSMHSGVSDHCALTATVSKVEL